MSIRNSGHSESRCTGASVKPNKDVELYLNVWHRADFLAFSPRDVGRVGTTLLCPRLHDGNRTRLLAPVFLRTKQAESSVFLRIAEASNGLA